MFQYDTTAIILDPSVDGIEGGNTSDREEATWSVAFPNYTISGIASCNTTEGIFAQPYSGNQNNIKPGTDGTKCWCRITGPMRSFWVFSNNYPDDSTCASDCAAICSRAFRGDAIFRNALFTTAGN